MRDEVSDVTFEILARFGRYFVVTPAGTNSGTGAAYPSNTVKFAWPTIQISGADIADGTYAMHAGCGNSNGVAGCDTFCRNLGLTVNANWIVPCGNGYPSGISAVVATGSEDTCLYRQGASNVASATGYVKYGSAVTCGNPMSDCVCDTS